MIKAFFFKRNKKESVSPGGTIVSGAEKVQIKGHVRRISLARQTESIKRLVTKSHYGSSSVRPIPTEGGVSNIEKYFRAYASESLVDLQEPKQPTAARLNQQLWSLIVSSLTSTQDLKNTALACRILYKAVVPILWHTLWIEVKPDLDGQHCGLKLPKSSVSICKKLVGNQCQCGRSVGTTMLHKTRCKTVMPRAILITNKNIRHILKQVSRRRGTNWLGNVRNVVAFVDDSTPTTEWNVLPPNMTTEALRWFVDTVIPEQCTNVNRMDLVTGMGNTTWTSLQMLTKLQELMSVENRTNADTLELEQYGRTDSVNLEMQVTLGHKTQIYLPLFTGNVTIIDLQIFSSESMAFAQLPISVRACRLRMACIVKPIQRVSSLASSGSTDLTAMESQDSLLSESVTCPWVTCSKLQHLFELVLELESLEVEFAGEFTYRDSFRWIPKSVVELSFFGDHCMPPTAASSPSVVVSLPNLTDLKINGEKMALVLATLHCPSLETLSVYNMQDVPGPGPRRRNILTCKSLSIANCSFESTKFLLQQSQSGLEPTIAKLSWRVREPWSERELSEMLIGAKALLASVKCLYLHFISTFPSINKPLVLDEISTCCGSLETCCIWDHDDDQYFVFTSAKNWSTHRLKVY